jgi:hypothetical protein
MIKSQLSRLTMVLLLVSPHAVHASQTDSDLNKDDAVKIISTLERLHPRHYQVIHILDGTQNQKDGFNHHFAKQISFFGPKDGSDTTRTLRYCTMLYSAEYGWFFQRKGRDARGFFLEISSQIKGRVFIR